MSVGVSVSVSKTMIAKSFYPLRLTTCDLRIL